jgi:hypothetical protein
MTPAELKNIFNLRFQGFLKTLKEISMDKNQGLSVINDEKELYYDFDGIKEREICKGAAEVLASPDTLIFKENEILLVEFKNGKLKNIKKEKKDIKLKAIEGGFIIIDKIVKKHDFSFLDVQGLKKSYILVYNSEKNPMEEMINRAAFTELEAALKVYEGNFFQNVAILPDTSFAEEHIKGCTEPALPGIE